MSYSVFEITGGAAKVRRITVETLDEAKAYMGKIVLIEEDEQHPDHFDAFTAKGALYAIEPA